VNQPPVRVRGTIRGLNDGLFSLRTHEAGGPAAKDGHVACLFASTWGRAEADVEALGERWRRLLDSIAAEQG